MLSGLPGFGIRSLSAEESPHHGVHLHHLLAADGLVQMDQDTDGKQNLIYKHAISTITPLRPISLLDAFEKEDSETKE